jgi:hypothetical protein
MTQQNEVKAKVIGQVKPKPRTIYQNKFHNMGGIGDKDIGEDCNVDFEDKEDRPPVYN